MVEKSAMEALKAEYDNTLKGNLRNPESAIRTGLSFGSRLPSGTDEDLRNRIPAIEGDVNECSPTPITGISPLDINYAHLDLSDNEKEQENRYILENLSKLASLANDADGNVPIENKIVFFHASITSLVTSHAVIGMIRNTKSGVKFGIMDPNHVFKVIRRVFLDEVDSFLAGIKSENAKEKFANNLKHWYEFGDEWYNEMKYFMVVQSGFFSQKELNKHKLRQFVSFAQNPISALEKTYGSEIHFHNYMRSKHENIRERVDDVGRDEWLYGADVFDHLPTIEFGYETAGPSIHQRGVHKKMPFLNMNITDYRTILDTVDQIKQTFAVFLAEFQQVTGKANETLGGKRVSGPPRKRTVRRRRPKRQRALSRRNKGWQ
jgi:hypothetical protein